MDTHPQFQTFTQVIRRIDPDAKLVRAWSLTGGVSAQVTALEIVSPDGQLAKLIVRQHGETDLKHNPNIAEDEYWLLRRLNADTIGLPVPRPYDYDQSGTILSTPYIVIEFIDGETDFTPNDTESYVVQLAIRLAELHSLQLYSSDRANLPEQILRYNTLASERPLLIDDTLHEGHIRAILESSLPLQQHNPTALLHGDYWPGNILWRDGQLVGIIDWEDAALGDPLADVANARFELLWALGADTMHAFTQRYQSLTNLDYTNLPYWELYAALRPIWKISTWAADAAAEQQMRERHLWFTAQAFRQLNIS
jgi:aminoglycoside phosphotransferase (APT) family kinase protein